MRVIVDGAEGFRFEGEPADVLAAVTAIADALNTQGRAMMSVRVDGKDMRAAELVEALGALSPADVETVEVTSESIRDLVDTSLSELEKALPELPTACHELARIFQGDTPTDGFEPFTRLAEIWEAVKSREIQVADALGIPLDTFEIGGVRIEKLHTELNAYLTEAAEALKAGDCVLLGDLLEYELAPRAETEAQIVSLLKEQSQQRIPPA